MASDRPEQGRTPKHDFHTQTRLPGRSREGGVYDGFRVGIRNVHLPRLEYLPVEYVPQHLSQSSSQQPGPFS